MYQNYFYLDFWPFYDHHFLEKLNKGHLAVGFVSLFSLKFALAPPPSPRKNFIRIHYPWKLKRKRQMGRKSLIIIFYQFLFKLCICLLFAVTDVYREKNKKTSMVAHSMPSKRKLISPSQFFTSKRIIMTFFCDHILWRFGR